MPFIPLPQSAPRSNVLDCNGSNAPDLWLRDGDVIEVPEKWAAVMERGCVAATSRSTDERRAGIG